MKRSWQRPVDQPSMPQQGYMCTTSYLGTQQQRLQRSVQAVGKPDRMFCADRTRESFCKTSSVMQHLHFLQVKSTSKWLV